MAKTKEMKEKKEKKEKKPEDQTKKKIRKRIVWGVIAAVVVFVIAAAVLGGDGGISVETVESYIGDIEQVVSTSGTVESEETKTYFAPISVRIGEINVEAGDSVKKGEMLFSYDTQELEKEKQTAELKLEAKEGGYDSSLSKDNKYIAELKEANVNLGVLEQQIEDSENYVRELKKRVADKKASLARQGALLQASLIEWSDRPNSEEYSNLQKEIQFNSYEQQNNQDILSWQSEIELYEEKIAAYKEYRSEMKAQKNTSETGAMNSGSKRQLDADTELEKLNNTSKLSAIEDVESGVKADFSGIVTELEIVEGQTPTEGMKMATLESTEKVRVAITVTKYDLEKIAVGQEAQIEIAGNNYTGRITKIDGMATKNANGVPVVGAEVEVDNPDEKIYLGIEAKVVISTEAVTNAVIVPMEAVNIDTKGDFVFVVENGVAVKKYVVVGISSDTSYEIKEGLAAGVEVIVTNDQEVEDGMAVTVS